MDVNNPYASVEARSDRWLGGRFYFLRRVLVLTPAILLAACGAEHVAGSNNNGKSAGQVPSFAGTMSASVTLTTVDGTRKSYQSGKIPYRTSVDGGKVVIPAPYIRDLRKSMIEVPQIGRMMIEVPQIGRIATPSFFAVENMSTRFSFSASTGDPEADLDYFAQSNPVGDQAEDVFLTQAEWGELTSDSYSEQISINGAIATMILDPISETNPYGKARLYLNGALVAMANPQYEPASGGYHNQTNGGATYSYSSGAQTSSATRTEGEHQVEPMSSPQDPKSELGRLYHPQYASLLNVFLPEMAYAQQQPPRENCAYYLRAALIGLAGMYFAGRSGNIEGFIISWISVVNSVHQYARCKERNVH